MHDQRRYLFYRYPEQQPELDEDGSVNEYTSWDDIPTGFRDGAMPSPWIDVMLHRQERGHTEFLHLADREAKLKAPG